MLFSDGFQEKNEVGLWACAEHGSRISEQGV